MKNSPIRVLALMATFVLLAISPGYVFAQGKGGGKGGGGNGGGDDGGPQPIPVQFEIISFSMPVAGASAEVRAMNNWGQVVGNYDGPVERSAFVYDPSLDPTTAIDLNSLVTVDPNWHIGWVNDINDLGQITGNLYEINGIRTKPFVIDLFQLTGPKLLELPDLAEEGINRLLGVAINNDSDVIVTYDGSGGTEGTTPDVYHFNPGSDFESQLDDTFEILPFRKSGGLVRSLSNSLGNRPGQIVGKLETGDAFRYTLGDTDPVILSDLANANTIGGTNDYGVIVGKMAVPWRKNKTIPMGFLYDDRKTESLQTWDFTSTPPQTLNNDSDFTISSASLIWFNHGGSIFYSFDETALVGDPQIINEFANRNFSFIKDLTMRGALVASDYPAMCGYYNCGGANVAFVLIPYSP